MGWHWGILASSGGAAGAYELLQSTILTSGASTVTFTGLGSYSGYKHLQLRIVIRNADTSGGSNDSLYLQFNNDTGANYAWHELSGNGSSVTSSATTSTNQIQGAYFSSDLATANAYAACVIDILDFSSSSKNTTIRSLSGRPQTSTRVSLLSGLWNNTAAVTEIDLFNVSATNFKTGSRFSLYGVK